MRHSTLAAFIGLMLCVASASLVVWIVYQLFAAASSYLPELPNG